jgi:beta-phosphoglucomutase-like phosphatase (HAD superfamily)
VFGCRAVEAHPTEKGGAPDPSCLLAAPGADHLFARIPRERWGVITAVDVAEATKQFEMAELALPGVFLASTGEIAKDYVTAAERLGADPNFCLAVEDSPEGIEAALQIGMKVIAVANELTPIELSGADMVIPSLLSLHVVGLHPVLVLEVDALPDYGTFNPGQIKRR